MAAACCSRSRASLGLGLSFQPHGDPCSVSVGREQVSPDRQASHQSPVHIQRHLSQQVWNLGLPRLPSLAPLHPSKPWGHPGVRGPVAGLLLSFSITAASGAQLMLSKAQRLPAEEKQWCELRREPCRLRHLLPSLDNLSLIPGANIIGRKTHVFIL